jgi:DNA polymerase-3 subunit epsilon
MAALDDCFVAIDFETSDSKRDSACAVGVIRVERGEIVARRSSLIRPPRRTFTTTFVHGITWAQVANAPTFGELWPELRPLLDGVRMIAAHNASFERSVLQTCCAASGHVAPAVPYLCTVELARQRWKLRPARLPDVCRFLSIPLRHHQAASDAEACAWIVIHAARQDRVALG